MENDHDLQWSKDKEMDNVFQLPELDPLAMAKHYGFGVDLEAAVWAILETPEWHWAARWWRFDKYKGIILEVLRNDGTGHVFEKGESFSCPPDVLALGCGGSSEGKCAWIAIDLDVGHGPHCYPNFSEALGAALDVHQKLGGGSEVRRSRSGNGVHLRVPLDSQIPESQAGDVAKKIARSFKLVACPTPLGRQRFWLWTRSPKPNAFRLEAAERGHQ